MKKIIHITFLLLAGIALAIYFYLPRSGTSELVIAKLDVPESQTWKMGLGDMDLASSSEGGMYLMKSLSGGFEVTLTPEGEGARLSVQPTSEATLDHPPAFISGISYDLRQQDDLRIKHSDGHVSAHPRFELIVEVTIIERFVLPHKLRYVWNLMYDSDSKQLGQLSSGGLSVEKSYRSLPLAHLVSKSDSIQGEELTELCLTRSVDEAGKLVPQSPQQPCASSRVALLRMEGGGSYSKNWYGLVRDYYRAYSKQPEASPVALLGELTTRAGGVLEDIRVLGSLKTRLRAAVQHGTPARLLTLAWRKTSQINPDKEAALSLSEDGEKLRYSYAAPLLGSDARLPLMSMSMNAPRKDSNDDRCQVTRQAWNAVPASWGWKGVKRVYSQTLIFERYQVSSLVATSEWKWETARLHIITAFEDEKGQIYELTWVPES